MKKVDITNFDEVLKSDKKVIIKFYADWCAPCKALSPILEDVKKELGDDVEVVEVNVDDSGELAQKYGIRGIPTMIFINEGEVSSTLVGNQTKDDIIKKVNEMK